MLTGFYSGISGMLYNEQRLSIVAHNAANADTPGFRRSLMMLRTREAPNNRGGVHSSVAKRTPKTFGVQRTGIFQDHHSVGTVHKTGNNLDLAIPTELPNAFFRVQDPQAPDGILYTRNGKISLGPQDPKNPNSQTVLYLSGRAALDPNQQPIPIMPENGALSVDLDGTVRQKGNEVGKLSVVRFNKSNDPTQQQDADLHLLERRGQSMVTIPDQHINQFFPQPLQVGVGNVSRLTLQGMRESSNVNMFNQMAEMMATTQATEANATAIQQHMDSLSKLFEVVRS